MHPGHQHLIRRLLERAAAEGLARGIITFKDHPQHVLRPETCLPLLTGLEERMDMLRQTGADFVIAISFTAATAELTAAEFVGALREQLKMRLLVIGPDFTVGRRREGNAEVLQRLGRQMGFTVEQVPAKTVNGGQEISSTAIRRALLQGDAALAGRLLQRPFTLTGQVVHGDKRGRTLGFPTANVCPSPRQLVPADGVYATRARIGARSFVSVTNIGKRPTFGELERCIEVFLIDFQAQIYEQKISVEFLERLRAEKRFESADALVAQIQRDVARAREIVGRI